MFIECYFHFIVVIIMSVVINVIIRTIKNVGYFLPPLPSLQIVIFIFIIKYVIIIILFILIINL